MQLSIIQAEQAEELDTPKKSHANDKPRCRCPCKKLRKAEEAVNDSTQKLKKSRRKRKDLATACTVYEARLAETEAECKVLREKYKSIDRELSEALRGSDGFIYLEFKENERCLNTKTKRDV